MLPTAFVYVNNEFRMKKKKVRVITPYKTYEGVIDLVDSEGNLKLRLTKGGNVVIVRKYITAVESTNQSTIQTSLSRDNGN